MTAPRVTLDRAGEPLVELQDTPGGILLNTFGWPRTLSDAEAEQLRDMLDAAIAGRRPAAPLTDRETEILRLLAVGLSNKEVARHLSISVRTVETHRLNLRRKTRTGRRSELVAMAARELGLERA